MQVDHTINIIEVENVAFAYEGEDVLKNMTLSIHPGDYIGIVGPNGAGKTTLLKIMLGLLHPKTGSVKLFEQDISNFRDWRKIGYVPQKATNFDVNFPATVSEVVSMGRNTKRSLFNKAATEDKRAVQNALEQVDMGEYKDRLIGDLSGGQQQRVFIARALVNQPEVIFLDEPTTGVDKQTQDGFFELFQKLNKKMGITIVLVSHDIVRLTKEVMHIACVDRSLTCHTSPEEYLKERQVADTMITHHHDH